jgi:hypothetical protein
LIESIVNNERRMWEKTEKKKQELAKKTLPSYADFWDVTGKKVEKAGELSSRTTAELVIENRGRFQEACTLGPTEALSFSLKQTRHSLFVLAASIVGATRKFQNKMGG